MEVWMHAFSFAAVRLGHSMVRRAYNWNKIFDNGAGTLELPLWFYILREAELNGGKLKGVGARIVADFHRAMEGSQVSIVRDPAWRPTLGPDNTTFRMVDVLLFAFEWKKSLLAPLG